MKTPPTPAGIEPATYRFLAQHLNHCAPAVPNQSVSQSDGITRPRPNVNSCYCGTERQSLHLGLYTTGDILFLLFPIYVRKYAETDSRCICVYIGPAQSCNIL